MFRPRIAEDRLIRGSKAWIETSTSAISRSDRAIALFEGVRRGLKRRRHDVGFDQHKIALFEGVRRGLKHFWRAGKDTIEADRLIRGSKAWIETRGSGASRARRRIALFEGVRRGLKPPMGKQSQTKQRSPYSRE